MKSIKLNTDVKITYNKKGNVKNVKSPYSNSRVMQPINTIAINNELTLRNIFTKWGNDFLINQNN